MKSNAKKIIVLFTMLSVALAVFAGCRKITVTFDPNEGEIVSGDVTAYYDGKTAVTAPDVKRDGYVFDGWSGEFEAPESDIEVKANWKKQHQLKFDIIDGETSDDIVRLLTSDEPVVYPEDPVREGYLFDGWDKQVEKIDSDTVVTAKWRKLYTVTFDLKGGTTTDESLLTQIIAEGDAATAPTAEKQYMEPVKWDKDFSKVTEDMTVSAVWTRRELTSNEIAKLVTPATVQVNTYRRNDIEWATGSGFFIDADGTIVTNYHVIEDAYVIKVKTDVGDIYQVTHVVAFDKDLDIAILKIAEKSPAYLERSDRKIEKGDVVYAIGSSLGEYDGSFTTGLISSVTREIEGQTYIQISAPISNGNSGGPLIDSRGMVIGINTLSDTRGQNLNFSIPIERMDELKNVDLTVSAWFDQYVELKWWLFEKNVDESEKVGTLTFMSVEEGATVNATHVSGDEDVYYFTYLKTMVSSLKREKLNVYFYFYTEDLSFFLGEVFSFYIVNTNNKTPVEALEYDDFDYFEYKDGYLFYACLYDIAEILKPYMSTSNMQLGIYLSNMLNITGKYSVFLETEIESIK